MALKENFAKRLKEIRKARGLTQEQLAELLGVVPRHISFIETARNFPSCDLIERISNTLGVSYSSLFDFKEEVSREELIEKLSGVIGKLDNKKLGYLLKMASEL